MIPARSELAKLIRSKGVLRRTSPGPGFPSFPKKKPRLGAQISVPPTIQNNAGDIAPGVEPQAAKHHRELFADALLVASKRRSDQLRAAPAYLLADGQFRIRKQNLE